MPVALAHGSTHTPDLSLALLVRLIEQFDQGTALAAPAAEQAPSSYQDVHG